jgi:hypothetical protein
MKSLLKEILLVYISLLSFNLRATDNHFENIIFSKNDIKRYKIESIVDSVFNNIYFEGLINFLYNENINSLTFHNIYFKDGRFLDENAYVKNCMMDFDAKLLIYGEGRNLTEKVYLDKKYKNTKLVQIDCGLPVLGLESGFSEEDSSYQIPSFEPLCNIFFNYSTNNKLLSQETINCEKQPNIYYLYNTQWELIGYYKTYNVNDSIAKGIKDDFTSQGYQKFNDKINTPFWSKIVENSYYPVKNNQLFVNKKPIKDFLASIGKRDYKYIIFEITDNYYFFYKLID